MDRPELTGSAGQAGNSAGQLWEDASSGGGCAGQLQGAGNGDGDEVVMLVVLALAVVLVVVVMMALVVVLVRAMRVEAMVTVKVALGVVSAIGRKLSPSPNSFCSPHEAQ